MSADAGLRTLTGVLTAHPDIKDTPHGNKIALLLLRPEGCAESYTATVAIGQDDRAKATIAALYSMAPGDPVRLKGYWAKAESTGPSGAKESWNFQASEAGRPQDRPPPAPEPAIGFVEAFKVAFARANGRGPDGGSDRSGRTSGGRLKDTRAPDYDPVAPRGRFAKPVAAPPRRQEDSLPLATIHGTMTKPVSHQRSDAGERTAVMTIRQDGKGELTATTPMRQTDGATGVAAFVSNLKPGDRVSLRGLWDLQDVEVGGRRRTVREFRATNVQAGPPEPEEPAITGHGTKAARGPRPPDRTTAAVEGSVIGRPSILADGRIGLAVKEGQQWKGVTQVTVDRSALGLPDTVAKAILDAPEGSPMKVRGAWQRSNRTEWTFAATHLTSDAIKTAWSSAGLSEPPAPDIVRSSHVIPKSNGAGF